MDLRTFCTQARVLIVAGKGGVGKTTVSATIARLASRVGLSVLVVEVQEMSGLPALFGMSGELDYQQATLAEDPSGGQVSARSLTADDALVEYLDEHGLRRVSKRLAATGTLDVVATAVPGIKDVLVLGKVKQMERAAVPDLIIVDAPAAGHAITFLSSAHGLVDAVTMGAIRNQSAEVVELLSDPERCQVMLVTLPEETPVNEAIDTAYRLEDKAGVKFAQVVVNGVYPHLHLPGTVRTVAKGAGIAIDERELSSLQAAADFRAHRQGLQGEQLARLSDGLPLHQLHLPYLFTTELGLGALDLLTDSMEVAVRSLGEDAL